MSEFNGLVLYTPNESVKSNLRLLMYHINNNKPNLDDIYKRNKKRGFLFNNTDYDNIEKEATSFLGWYYTSKRPWVVRVEEVLSMLLVNDVCYITPKQVSSLLYAVEQSDLFMGTQSKQMVKHTNINGRVSDD